eukprot:7955847-Pyramimonas_sp.AAC.1
MRGLLGAVLGWSWGLSEHFQNHLEASEAISRHLGGYLGPSEALLEPCTLPEGEEWGWKRNSLISHLRPKGW